MPQIIYSGGNGIEMGETYDYTYPMGMDLKPGSKLHTKLLTKILQRVRSSKTEMEKRYPYFDKIQQKLSAYVIMNDEERELVQENPTRPIAVNIPILHTNLDTLLAYYMSAFDGVLFKYHGVGPEDRVKAMLLELLIDTQCQRAKSLLPLYIQWRDALSMGMGIVSCRWHKEFGNKTTLKPNGFFSSVLGRMLEMGIGRVTNRELLWEANLLENVHPKKYFPDPSMPVHKVQEMEFVSFLRTTNYVNILGDEKNEPTQWFNGRYFKQLYGYSEFNCDAPKSSAVGTSSYPRDYGHRPVDDLEYYGTIIPREWGVGKNEYPEKWLFTVGGDRIIRRATPMNLNHNKYPVCVASPSFDGYSVAPISTIEPNYEAQVAADFFYKARMHNMLTMINNRGIIDPSLARYDDAISAKPGGWIRIREQVWGRGVQNAVEALPAPDFTTGYRDEIQFLNQMSNNASGAVDSLQGIVRPSGERRSATEMRDTRGSAISRIQKGARLSSIMSMNDLGYMFAYHNQQFLSKPALVELTGGNAAELRMIYQDTHQTVNPDDLLIDFDVVPGDGVTPGGEFLPDLIQMFQLCQSNQQTLMAFDPVKQLLDMYARAGVKGATNLLVPQVVGALQQQMAMASGMATQVPTEALAPIPGMTPGGPMPEPQAAASGGGIGPNVPTPGM